MKILQNHITLNDFRSILLLIFVFLLPFNHYISSYFLASYFILSLFNKGFFKNIGIQNKSIFTKIIFFLILSLYFIGALSLLHGGDIKVGINSLTHKLSLLIFPLVLFSNEFNEKHIKKILLLFVFGVFLSSVLCLILVFVKQVNYTDSGLVFNYEVYENYTNGFIESIFKRNNYLTYSFLSHFLHPAYLAVYIIFSLGIVYNFLRKDMFNKINKIFAVLLLFYFLFFILLLNVRASFISVIFLIISVIIYELLKYKNKKIIFLLVLILITVTASILSNSRIKSNLSDLYETVFFGTDSDKKYDDRIYIWRGSISVIKDNFWLGSGISKSDQYLKESFQEQDYKQGVKEGFNSHNQFLDIWLETGIFGFLMFVSIFLTAFIFSIRKRSFLLFLFSGIIFINLLFESMLNRFAGVSFFTLFLFLLILRINISNKDIIKE